MRAKDFWIQLVLLLALGAAAAFGQTTIGATPTPDCHVSINGGPQTCPTTPAPKCVNGSSVKDCICPEKACEWAWDHWNIPPQTDWPKIVSAQLILDPVQAKYPGNEKARACGPDNHDGVCVDSTLRHITNRIYGSDKARCEHDEGVACYDLWMGGPLQEYWVPIGKPVFVDETDGPVGKPVFYANNIIQGEETGTHYEFHLPGAVIEGKEGRVIKLSSDEYDGLQALREMVTGEERHLAAVHGVQLDRVMIHQGTGVCLTGDTVTTYQNPHAVMGVFSNDLSGGCDVDQYSEPDHFEFRGQFLLVNVPDEAKK